jgi:single-stranded DNA-specific DHH superfamily exonuclease
MKYLSGSEQNFHDFVDSIGKEEKIGIITHTDLDGIASGIFLKKILESKKLKVNFIEFTQYGFGVLKPLFKKDFDILFFTDWNVDNYQEDLTELKKKARVFVIDHHPLNPELRDKSGFIKTDSSYCSAHTLFDLAKEGKYFDTKPWEWLVCSAIIMDYTFDNMENLKFLKSVYPEITPENIWESEPGKIG